MPIFAILFGLALEALGIFGFGMSAHHSVTALIPSIFGSLLLVLGVVGLLWPHARKHVMHVAALIGLVGTVGGLGRGLPKLGALFQGTAELPLAVFSQVTMGVLCLGFLVLCVKSFIDARRARKAGGA